MGPESCLLEYESPLFENPEKRESMLRLSKRDLLRLSKRDLLRLSKRDFLCLTKKSEDSSNRDLRLSKRPEWSERDLSRLLNSGSLGREAGELGLANRLSKRTFETVN